MAGIGLDKCREWLWDRGYHAQGNFHVQFANGGQVDLAEMLSLFLEDVGQEIADLIASGEYKVEKRKPV